MQLGTGIGKVAKRFEMQVLGRCSRARFFGLGGGGSPGGGAGGAQFCTKILAMRVGGKLAYFPQPKPKMQKILEIRRGFGIFAATKAVQS